MNLSFNAWAVLFTPSILTGLVGIIGLLVGSFLNVLIYRLPIILQRQWRKECLGYLNLADDNKNCVEDVCNLALPASHCVHCKVPILIRHNIPLLSYLFLRGRCAACHEPISARYPVVEFLTACTSMMVAWHFGPSVQTIAALLLTWGVIALSFIDLEHQLLPDTLVLPLLWIGLLLNEWTVFSSPQSSILGAACGYLSLWLVYYSFKLVTKKEGMGRGDFKLLAMLGAWLGWQYLALMILLSSVVGVVIGMTLISLNKQQRETPIPFGPYLAIAGWLALLWGDKLNAWYFG